MGGALSVEDPQEASQTQVVDIEDTNKCDAASTATDSDACECEEKKCNYNPKLGKVLLCVSVLRGPWERLTSRLFLVNTVKGYYRHLIVCDGKEDWIKKLEKEQDSIAQVFKQTAAQFDPVSIHHSMNHKLRLVADRPSSHSATRRQDLHGDCCERDIHRTTGNFRCARLSRGEQHCNSVLLLPCLWRSNNPFVGNQICWSDERKRCGLLPSTSHRRQSLRRVVSPANRLQTHRARLHPRHKRQTLWQNRDSGIDRLGSRDG